MAFSLFLGNQMYFMGVWDSVNYNFCMVKYTYNNSSVDWAKTIVCVSTNWTTSLSESKLSTDNTKIYSFFVFGNPTMFYLITLSFANGSVIGNRYRSSVTWMQVYGSAINGNYVAANLVWSSISYLVLYNTATSAINLKTFNGDTLVGLSVEPSVGR